MGKKENVETVTISFDTDGGTKIDDIEIIKGGKLKKVDEPKEGYIFIGWLLNNNEFNLDSKIDSNIKLVANYQKIDDDTFVVNFDSKGGSSIQKQVVKKDEKVEKPKNPTKKGYNFEGWYLNNNKYNFNTKVTENITLIARWSSIPNTNTQTQTKPENPVETPTQSTTKKWTVKFNLNGKITSQEVEDGNLVTKPTNLSVPSGMELKYWEDESTGNEFDFNTKIKKDYNLAGVYGPITETPPQDSKITSAPSNIYFSSTENGTYTEKKGISDRTRTVIELDDFAGYYKLQATNSNSIGPMSDPIYIPGKYKSNITSSFTCNVTYSASQQRYTYNGGKVDVSNPGNNDIRILLTKYNDGDRPIYSVKEDLGAVTTKNISYACFEYAPLKGLNYYYTVISLKKGTKYLIYSVDYNEIEKYISNTTYVD